MRKPIFTIPRRGRHDLGTVRLPAGSKRKAGGS